MYYSYLMDNQPQNIIIKKPRKQRDKPVDKQLITAMLAKGYTKVAIAKQADCHEKTVYAIQNGAHDKSLIISEFIRDRANLFAIEQKERIELSRRLRESIGKDLEAGILKGSEKGKIVFYLDQGFGIFYDKERIEKGKATSITAGIQLFLVQAHQNI